MQNRTYTNSVLNSQAEHIEAILAQHHLDVRVTGGLLSPRWVQFRILPGLGVKISAIRDRDEEIAHALGVVTCRIARQRGQVVIEIPRADPQSVRLLPLYRRLQQREPIPFGSAVLGLAEDGAPLLMRLPSPQVAHVLIAGTTGSGKSALAQSIITSLALNHRPSQLSFVLIDPKRRAFGPLAGLPHLLRPVLSEPDEITALLAQLVQLMLERDRAGLLPANAASPGEARVVVVIDELADVLMQSAPAGEHLTRLVQRGRAAGIHLIACTQKPAAAVVGSLAKANFPVRLVGHVVSPEDAKVATGYAGSGAEALIGPGDFIAITGGQMQRFQAAYITGDEIRAAIVQMRQERTPLPLPPAPELPAAADHLTDYTARARPVWKRLAHNGRLPHGGKAALAEAVFGNRSTAGHQGRWINRVIEALRGESATTFASSAAALGARLAPRKTTTTTTWKPAFFRPRRTMRRFEVVVVGFRSEL